MEEKIDIVYENVKTGERYVFCGEAINTTNKVDGQEMIIYRALTNYDSPTFVRSKKEFNRKFCRVV